MRYLNGSEMGWIAVPFIFAVGAAYVWLAGRLLNRSTVARTPEQSVKETKVAKAA